MARATAWARRPTSLALWPLTGAFTLDRIFSTGFGSGLQGSRYGTVAPRAPTASATPAVRWADRLPGTTTSPGRSVGARTSRTQPTKRPC